MSNNPSPIGSHNLSSSKPAINNDSNEIVNHHPILRSPIVVHQQNSSPVSIRSVIVKPQRDLNLQSATKNPNQSLDMKPVVIQTHGTADSQQPHKKIALESTDLRNTLITFTPIPKPEVFNTFQSSPTHSNVSLPNTTKQSSSSIPSFSTIRLINPSKYVHSQNAQPITQPLLFQQHRNVILQQPIIALQVQQDQSTVHKEAPLQNLAATTDTSTSDAKAPVSDFIPVQYQRKPCNCTKSMCLKLYCDCFANGLHCQNCSCLNCHNDGRHEDDRRRAISATLERNPHAFKSKMYKFANPLTVQSDRPLKGCNCKKSSCHKRYCECYEARIPCTNLCKCVGCKNTEESVNLSNAGLYQSNQTKGFGQTPLDQIPRTGPPIESAAPNNVFNMEVTEALATCLLIAGQQCERNQMNEHDSQEAILKEFQRCMHHVVQSALGRSSSP